MASSLPTASSVSLTRPSFSVQRHYHSSKVSFRFSSKPKLLFATKGLRSSQNHYVVKAQTNEVSVDGSSNASPTTHLEVPISEVKDIKPSPEPSSTAPLSESAISEFMTQVASLVKLVDSRDIVELQLKQLDCELIIRKKEALPQPPVPAPVVMISSPSPPVVTPSHFPSTTTVAPAPSATAPPPSVPVLPSPAKSATSSFPPLKCPMAGTFYRCPAPGEPPLVKVGDKVQKGQVLCIIEAMKLMNEIEADQSGTVVEILVDDAKPVSMDTPLFVIQP